MDRLVQDAINQSLSYYDAPWGFHRMMTKGLRDALDTELVARKHPIAFEPGTQWDRFQRLHRDRYQF